MRQVLLLCGLVLVAGCDNLSISITLPASDDDATLEELTDDTDIVASSDGFLLCVTNLSTESITYRVGMTGQDLMADTAPAGSSVCYDAPCGFDFGIDQIVGETISNPLGAQYLASQAPCGSTVELRVQSDGTVEAFVDTSSTDS